MRLVVSAPTLTTFPTDKGGSSTCSSTFRTERTVWRSKDGNCNCYFCINNKPHKHSMLTEWQQHGYLQVAESLDPKDIISTRVCNLCAHEERSAT